MHDTKVISIGCCRFTHATKLRQLMQQLLRSIEMKTEFITQPAATTCSYYTWLFSIHQFVT